MIISNNTDLEIGLLSQNLQVIIIRVIEYVIVHGLQLQVSSVELFIHCVSNYCRSESMREELQATMDKLLEAGD